MVEPMPIDVAQCFNGRYIYGLIEKQRFSGIVPSNNISPRWMMIDVKCDDRKFIYGVTEQHISCVSSNYMFFSTAEAMQKRNKQLMRLEFLTAAVPSKNSSSM